MITCSKCGQLYSETMLHICDFQPNPQPHAAICPVCGGKGVVYGIAETGAFPTETCHGCGGLGWVTVR